MSVTSPEAPERTIAGQVHTYALAVRAALADLPEEQVDELVDGLEADLTEALADSAGRAGTAWPGTSAEAPSEVPDGGPLAAVFGPAEEYAAELRAAGGLGPATTGPETRHTVRAAVADAAHRAADRWRETWAPLMSTPGGSAVVDFLRTLRPLWWVYRGWFVAGVLWAYFSSDRGPQLVPESLATWVLVLAMVVVSVQWGRGRWKPWRWLRGLVRVLSVVAVLFGYAMIHAAVYNTGDAFAQDRGLYDAQTTAPDGVWSGGRQVGNLFAFDAAGKPLDDVRIFDDAGEPVRTQAFGDGAEPTEVWRAPGTYYARPQATAGGSRPTNVYPLQVFDEADGTWDDDGMTFLPSDPESVRDAPSPFVVVPPLEVAGASAQAPDPAATDDPADKAAEAPADKAAKKATEAPAQKSTEPEPKVSAGPAEAAPSGTPTP
ncbi:hypothetical protein [Cellulomonas sp. PhB143]|uniref:hypothetical protein n=1 Tax=Cellulomonas sp. PhB143 TaxID=2485186 RepID=UPI000F48AC1C|nr:hypothetical protein [Cellulomonas sp. PhB143]ROS78657.1 hypothetical protein EDF32_0558 [Cellulomonas sp. PhB143]